MTGGSYYTPRGILIGTAAKDAVAADFAWPLLSDGAAFTALEITQVDNGAVCHSTVPRDGKISDLSAFHGKRTAFAGLDMGRARIMGILNVTPDSFSDGGKFDVAETAIADGVAMTEAGADIVDVGGESTRPGATPVAADEETRRVIPVIKGLAARGICVSVDTRHAAVMAAAVESGARIVNDVTALTGDADALGVVVQSGASVVLMHMQGEPRTMQANPIYTWAPGDVFDYLMQRTNVCVAAGMTLDRIAVDPGIGFGKTPQQSAAILDHIAMFHGMGCVVMAGASRKSFIAALSNKEPVEARLAGSLAAALHAATHGVQILRVHDVAETCQALAVNECLVSGA